MKFEGGIFRISTLGAPDPPVSCQMINTVAQGVLGRNRLRPQLCWSSDSSFPRIRNTDLNLVCDRGYSPIVGQRLYNLRFLFGAPGVFAMISFSCCKFSCYRQINSNLLVEPWNQGRNGSVRVSPHWGSDEGAIEGLALFVPARQIVLATATWDILLSSPIQQFFT